MVSMKNRQLLSAIFFFALLVLADAASAAVPAFPEAEGGGATSVGGRGGRVIHVTNLNSEGPGSLREAMEAKGPRIVVFDVAGIIHLQKTVANPGGSIEVGNPYLTVAGQTAPGGGITVHGSIYINTHDVVVRFITVRLQPAPRNYMLYQAAVSFGRGTSNIYNNIVDHVSASWSSRTMMGAWTTTGIARDITYQWVLLAEGMKYPEGYTGYPAMLFSSIENVNNLYNISVHHNLMMKFTNRMPWAITKDIRIINNIMYYRSWVFTQIFGGIKADIIGNIYKDKSVIDDKVVRWYSSAGDNQVLPGSPSIYINKNIGPNHSNPNADNWPMVGSGDPPRTAPTSWQRLEPLPALKYPETVHSTAVLEGLVLNDVGNSRRLDENGNWVSRRDSVDTRLINEYRTNTGKILPSDPSEVGGWPIIAPGTPYTDTDRDGMPDAWEIKNGLNPNNAADGNQDADGDGYTNVEEFLNGESSTITNPILSCTDNIQNQGETGIDCGGSCPACSVASQSLSLKPGWNQISSPVAAGIDIATIESSCTILQYKNQKLWAWNATSQVWINPSKVEPFRGYWIYSAYQCAVPLSGTPATFTSLQLYSGWNKISASGTFSAIKGTCANHITGNWIWHWDKTTEKWIHPTTMQLDKGYWIKVEGDCVLGVVG